MNENPERGLHADSSCDPSAALCLRDEDEAPSVSHWMYAHKVAQTKRHNRGRASHQICMGRLRRSELNF